MDVELDLANILKAISFAEITLENQRIRVAENPNFDIHSVFVAQKPLNLITSQDLVDFLSVYRVALTPRESEYLINLNAEAPNLMTFDSFFRTILPKTDKKLFERCSKPRSFSHLRTYNKHFSSENTILAVSEREVARLFAEELRFYREHEKLKREFQENHAYTLRELFKIIDFKAKGFLDYESLCSFFTKLQVLFTKHEFFALLRRIAVNLDNKIECEELVYAVFPNEPCDYPAFRGHGSQKLDISGKPREFGFEICEKPLGLRHALFLKKENGFLKEKNRLLAGNLQKKHYIYDESYHKELHDYRAKYVEPAKTQAIVAKSRENRGFRAKNLEDFFEDYLLYLRDREKTEEFFNKYGKRYAFLDKQQETAVSQRETLRKDQQICVDVFRMELNSKKK